MRLLVTGGAGSLGSNLIERIGMKCEEILVIDNFTTGKRASLPPLPNLQVVEGVIWIVLRDSAQVSVRSSR